MKTKLKRIFLRSRIAWFMKNNFYHVRRYFKSYMKSVNTQITALAKVMGKSRATLFVDMLWKSYVTMATYQDYFRFEFFGKTLKEANKYLTYGKYWRLYDILNSPENRRVLTNKPLFCEVFCDYIKRDWLHITAGTTPEELKNFSEKHKVFIAKREDLNMGIGIQLINSEQFASSEELLAHLNENMLVLVEEKLENHEALKLFSKVSLNTLRVITVRLPEGVKIIGVLFKFGDGYNIADSPGEGYKCPVNPETGVIYRGVTGSHALKNVFLKTHPAGYELMGLKIPFWDEVVSLVDAAALHLDNCFYVPWDVAVTPTGPKIVEGNCHCGYDYQWTTGYPTYLY